MGEQPQKVPERQVVSFRKKVSPEPGGEATKSDRPLIRKPLTGRRRSKMPSPTSDLLPLEKRPSLPPRPASNEQPDVVQAVIAEKVSSEILLSRFLSGIIDLGLAGLGGVFCAFLASRIVGVPYYSADVLGLVILSAILLFFINSVFFLVLLAKTPGMMWTDLRLVEDERDHPTSGAVLLRTLLFLPLAASVVGLVWALFDDQRRCWHDQLSGTRVVADSGN